MSELGKVGINLPKEINKDKNEKTIYELIYLLINLIAAEMIDILWIMPGNHQTS